MRTLSEGLPSRGGNFSTTADVFGGTLVFGSGSIFSGITYSFNNQTGLCVNGSCSFGLNTIVSRDNLTYNINLNLSTDQYTASGKISKTNGQFSWSYSGKGTDPLRNQAERAQTTRLGVLRTVHS